MTFGEPNRSSGAPKEEHPGHLKDPDAAPEPPEAKSFAPVHRNRPPGVPGWGPP